MSFIRSPQGEFTIEDLDRELIARGAKIPHEDLFKFTDVEGTPARDEIMNGIKELYGEAPSPNPALASIDTWELYRLLYSKTQKLEENRNRGIWEKDDRMDYFGIRDERVVKNADCVAAILLKKNLIDEKNGFSTLRVKNYGETHNLCELEHFREQPVTAGWISTGFLVKKNVIATACHSALRHVLRDLRFVFGFKMSDSSTPVVRVPEENIYEGKKIINCAYMPDGNGSDWALVKLDREVENQEVVMLTEDEIECQQEVYLIGHPQGLPIKYAPGARVRGFKKSLFTADLDTYMGNSGSPVFNSETHEVIGIVVHGDTRDLRWTGKGWGSVIYPNRNIYTRKPQCTRVSRFKEIVDILK